MNRSEVFVLVNEDGDIRSAMGRDGRGRALVYDTYESAAQVSRGSSRGPWKVHHALLEVWGEVT